jgi:hypothetical protein
MSVACLYMIIKLPLISLEILQSGLLVGWGGGGGADVQKFEMMMND